MRDQEIRRRLRRYVFGELRRASFRELLSERTDDGERRIVFALAADQANLVLDEVVASGGRANVVVGHDDYLRIVPICVQRVQPTDKQPDNTIRYHVANDENITDFLDRARLSSEAAALASAVRVGQSVRLPVAAA